MTMSQPELNESARRAVISTIHEHWDIPAEGKRTDIYGRYEDELVKVDGTWMFQARRFHPTSRRSIRIEG